MTHQSIHLSIRQAAIADAEPIANCLLWAMEEIFYKFIGTNDFRVANKVMLQFVKQDMGQYSYRNCWVAKHNGEVVAAINGYDGAKLEQLRAPVLAYIREHFNPMFQPEDETEAGEFYIDSLGVVPHWRGKGIGTKLLEHLIHIIAVQRHQTIGLLVEPENASAKRLYAQLGFKCVGFKPLAGKQLEHLQLQRSL